MNKTLEEMEEIVDKLDKIIPCLDQDRSPYVGIFSTESVEVLVVMRVDPEETESSDIPLILRGAFQFLKERC